MDNWKRSRLGDLVETQKGYAFKSGWYCDAGRPIVKVSDFTSDSVDHGALVCIPESTAVDYLKYELRTGDVVVQTVGSWPTNPASVVGKCVRIPEKVAGALLNQNAVKLTPSEALDKTFLFYLVRNEDFKTYIIGTAQGAASQAAITLEAIRGYEFPLPPLPIQRRIAGILSDYDELIENNQRRIKILEAMARNLYREWFVHFRFPGHESVPSVPSPLGDIPQEWGVKLVKEILSRRAAGTVYREADVRKEGAIPVVDQSTNELLGFHDDKPDHTASPATPIAIFGDHTCKMQIFIEPFSVGPNVVPFVANRELPTAYVFYAVNSLVQTQEYKRHWSPLNAKEVIVADNTTAQQFASIIQPMLVEQATFGKIIRNLRRTRDLLLPRLLSGQIDVEAIAS